MDFIINALELFQHGGWVMYPLLACSVLVVAIAIERYTYYKRNCAGKAVVDTVLKLIRQRSWQELNEFCMGNHCVLSDVLVNGLQSRPDVSSVKDSFEEYTSVRANAMKRNLNYLDTIVTMAPLLGLLGTVIGMISSFRVLDVAGDNPALITGGVGEALVATATGLCVAVLSLIVHSYYSNRLDSTLTDVEVACTLAISELREDNNEHKK